MYCNLSLFAIEKIEATSKGTNRRAKTKFSKSIETNGRLLHGIKVGFPIMG